MTRARIERGGKNGWFDLFGYAAAPSGSSSETPTITEQVPLAYQPQAAPSVIDQPVQIAVFHHSCFGAGTRVRTIDGLHPIESLRIGDQVLTQNPKTGALKYQPVVTVFHNPPNATLRIELGHDSIVLTGIHRLWKAGQGWVMARELKAGDTLRTLGGTAAIKSIVEERKQPVFNLQVADGESFFVGPSGVLAHDNSLINPTPDPFDSVELWRAEARNPEFQNHAFTFPSNIPRCAMVYAAFLCCAILGDQNTPADSATGDLAAYQTAAKAAGRDADAQVRSGAPVRSARPLGRAGQAPLAGGALRSDQRAVRGLLGLVEYQGKWQRPDQISKAVQDDPERKARVQE